jgi:hypothetical protein
MQERIFMQEERLQQVSTDYSCNRRLYNFSPNRSAKCDMPNLANARSIPQKMICEPR